MNEIISVIFNDGSRWDNLTLDGSSLVSKKPLDPSKIDNCPENLKIVDSEGEIIFMFDYALISSYGGPNEIGEYYVAIYPLTSEKMRECEVNSKLDYLSLMTGIDLENEIEKVRTISNERGGGTARNTQLLCDISESVFGTKQRCELLSTKAGSPCSNSRLLQGRDTNFLLLSGTLFEIQKGGVAA